MTKSEGAAYAIAALNGLIVLLHIPLVISYVRMEQAGSAAFYSAVGVGWIFATGLWFRVARAHRSQR